MFKKTIEVKIKVNKIEVKPIKFPLCIGSI